MKSRSKNRVGFLENVLEMSQLVVEAYIRHDA